jgi:hypothetical protein
VLPERPQLLTPDLNGPDGWIHVLARLKPDATAAQASAAATVVWQQMMKERADRLGLQKLPPSALQRISLVTAAHGYAPQRRLFAQPLTILMTIVGLVLLIACANVATLLIARSAPRRRPASRGWPAGCRRGSSRPSACGVPLLVGRDFTQRDTGPAPLVFLTIATTLRPVTLPAAYLPARRATQVDLVRALRL